jgi:hypothetical protein
MVNRRVDSGHCYPEGFDIMKIRFKCPKVPKVLKPNVSNWRTWLRNSVLGVGCFLAGGLFATDPPVFMQGVMPAKKIAPAVVVKEVKTATLSVDRATVACTASLAATENLRKDIVELCRAKAAPAKAAVAK